MKTPLPLTAHSLSMSCGFPINWGAKFTLDGSEYRFGAANIAHLELLARIRAAVPAQASIHWLLPFRDMVRSTTAGAVFAYAATHTTDPPTRCLAVWLRGRRGGRLGSAAIAALYRGGETPLRKAVVRALQRMHAWAALRRIQACEPDPRIRRLAGQNGPRAYSSRMSEFISRLTPGPRSSEAATLFEREGLELGVALPPRSGSFFRTILDRIRRLVRAGTKQAGEPKQPIQEGNMTPCVHLMQLYQLCQESQLKLSSSDLIHVICKQCQKEEVCPSLLMEEYEEHHPEIASADRQAQDR